jgi:tetratricopeptide (TPR) repeat protein
MPPNPFARNRRRLAVGGTLFAAWCVVSGSRPAAGQAAAQPAAPSVSQASGQENVSALPPPVTRSLYRSRWFEFLNALLEDDVKGAAAALADMKKAARAVGVRRLSDFSRTAVHEGRKAESLGKPDRAARAYDAAIQLDDASYDALAARVSFLFRRKSYVAAIGAVPDAVSALFETQESRLSMLSSLALWVAAALGLTLAGTVLALLGKNAARMAHDATELSRRWGGVPILPLAILLAALPVALGLGPGWIVLYWGVLVFPYALPSERTLLAVEFVALGLVTPTLALVSRENVIERSPLYVAAMDLDERREDASAEDGLRQASGVFAEDVDVWFLLGMYADRAGDSDRAISSYDRAIIADPRDYRPFLNRGNVHFQEGDFLEAIRDYEAASQRSPSLPEIYYNISLARGEAYDFPGQAAAIAKARAISDKDVVAWTERPTLNRVVAAGYPLSRARMKIEQWNQQPKSRRLPGHAPPIQIVSLFFSPLALGPWVALGGALALASWRERRSLAIECARCGSPVCDFCRRFGDHPLYCTTCVRLHVRKENLGIQAHVAQSQEMRRRVSARDRLCHAFSLLVPGTHKLFTERTFAGAVLLFCFCLLASVALVGNRYFDPRQLPGSGGGQAWLYVFGAGALLVWMSSLATSFRNSHGS